VVNGADSGASLDEVEVDDPQAGEVRITMAASGICGSDLHVLHGRTTAGVFPCVLGHEGAGVVESVGAGVNGYEPGTRVIVGMGASCGRCARCAVGDAVLCEDPGRGNRLRGLMGDGSARLHRDGEVVHPFVGCGTLAEHVVLPAHELIPLPDGVPFEVACLTACGVTTGLGAVFNVARVEPGSTALVVGCGGVGLNVIQGLRLSGASRVIATDTNPAKLALAERMGATDVVASLSEVGALLPRGVDYAFEVVGVPELVVEALELTRPGGTCVAVGSNPPGSVFQVPAATLFPQRRLLGCMAGGNVPRREIPRILDLYRAGRLDLNTLVGTTLPFDKVDEAIAIAESGDVARAVVTF
jgi:S-(hydroxymethyl)glutathione dehydrogenase/alcohol dehydrogenase